MSVFTFFFVLLGMKVLSLLEFKQIDEVFITVVF